MIETDEQLVEAYRKGDQDAFARLTERYIHSIFAYVSRLSGSGEEANDITQEAFVKAWRKLWQFDTKKSFKAWLFAIAYHAMVDWSRKKRSTLFSSFETEEFSLEDTLIDPEPLPEEVFTHKELTEELERAITQLPVSYRNIVLLRLADDLTLAEVATILRKPLNTVKSQYLRAVKLLREILTRTHPELHS